MDFSDYLEQYLDARDKLTWERRKTPPSTSAVEWAEEDFARCAKDIKEHVNEQICKLAGIAMREYGE